MPELAKFDPAAIADGLKDKIRAEVANLIPEDTIKEMIKSVTQEFIEGRRQQYSNERIFDGNTLKGIVTQIIKEHIVNAARAELDSPAWRDQFEGTGRRVAGEAMKAMLKENMDLMLVNMMAAVATGASDQLRHQLQQALGRAI